MRSYRTPGSGMAVSVEMSQSLPSLAVINLSAKQQVPRLRR
ncbi:MAG: hypothetical protein OJF50_004534 [Nitrospira sp.]|nr:hypothetical protein [Nitrospira sp.]